MTIFIEPIPEPDQVLEHARHEPAGDVGLPLEVPAQQLPFPGEGHTVVYYRYEEIIQAMLEAWE